MLFKIFSSDFAAVSSCLSVLVLRVPDRSYPYALQFPRRRLVYLNFSTLINHTEVRSRVPHQESLVSADLKHLILVQTHADMRSEVRLENVLHQRRPRGGDWLQRDQVNTR